MDDEEAYRKSTCAHEIVKVALALLPCLVLVCSLWSRMCFLSIRHMAMDTARHQICTKHLLRSFLYNLPTLHGLQSSTDVYIYCACILP